VSLYVSLVVFDANEERNVRPLASRVAPIEKTTDLKRIPELAAFLGTEVLEKDLLNKEKLEDIEVYILEAIGNKRSVINFGSGLAFLPHEENV